MSSELAFTDVIKNTWNVSWPSSLGQTSLDHFGPRQTPSPTNSYPFPAIETVYIQEDFISIFN